MVAKRREGKRAHQCEAMRTLVSRTMYISNCRLVKIAAPPLGRLCAACVGWCRTANSAGSYRRKYLGRHWPASCGGVVFGVNKTAHACTSSLRLAHPVFAADRLRRPRTTDGDRSHGTPPHAAAAQFLADPYRGHRPRERLARG